MNDSHTAPKSMRLFFIDNQGAWPKGASLVGDLVLWKDPGSYPTYSPVAVAEHPNFDGKIVVHAGNRGVVVTFVDGAHTTDEVRQVMSKGKPDQYRVAIDALIHRMVLWRESIINEDDHQQADDADALSLAAWMAASERSRPYAHVVAAALSDLMHNPERIKTVTADIIAKGAAPDADAFEMADAILTSMVQAMAAKDVQQPVSPLKKRTG